MFRPSTYELLGSGLIAAVLVGALVSGRGGWRLLGLRSAPAVGVLALASAAGCALAPGAPTGVNAEDIVLRALFGLSATLLASTARRWAWVAASVLAVVGSYDEAWVVLALVALGLGVGSLLADRPASGNVVGALIGAGTAQVLLRLNYSPDFGVSAAIAGLALVVLFVGGFRHTLRPTYRWLGRGVLGLGVLVIAAAVLAGVAVLHARGPAEQGLAQAEAAVTAAGSNHASAATADLHASAGHLAQAHDRLTRWWAMPGVVLPVVSQNERALRVLTSQGTQVADAAVALVGATESGSGGDGSSGAGSVDVGRLTALEPAVNASLATVQRADSALGALRSPWLVSAISTRLAKLDTKVALLNADETKLSQGLKVLPGLLGANGPQTYLVMVQDPSELRGGGGVIGDRAILTVDNGHLSLSNFAPLTAVPMGTAPLQVTPATAQWAEGEGIDLTQYPEDDSFSPDFPTDARLFESSEAQLGAPSVNGVISVDPTFLQAILGITGPVRVAGWPVPLSASNVEPILLHDQYVRLTGTARQAFLAAATSTIFQAFTHHALPGPLTLARALAPAVTSKHLIVYSNDQATEHSLGVIGVGGAMPPVRGDFLEVVTQNAVTDKDDWYLRRSFDYQVSYDPSNGRVNATLTITLTNTSPSSGQPAYVIGGGPGEPLHAGTSADLLTVYTPLHLVRRTQPGANPLLSSQVEEGRNAYSGFVKIDPGSSTKVSLHLTGQVSGGTTYALYSADQTAVAPDGVSVRVNPTAGWKATSAVGLKLDGAGSAIAGRTNSDHPVSTNFSRTR